MIESYNFKKEFVIQCVNKASEVYVFVSLTGGGYYFRVTKKVALDWLNPYPCEYIECYIRWDEDNKQLLIG